MKYLVFSLIIITSCSNNNTQKLKSNLPNESIINKNDSVLNSLFKTNTLPFSMRIDSKDWIDFSEIKEIDRNILLKYLDSNQLNDNDGGFRSFRPICKIQQNSEIVYILYMNSNNFNGYILTNLVNNKFKNIQYFCGTIGEFDATYQIESIISNELRLLCEELFIDNSNIETQFTGKKVVSEFKFENDLFKLLSTDTTQVNLNYDENPDSRARILIKK